VDTRPYTKNTFFANISVFCKPTYDLSAVQLQSIKFYRDYYYDYYYYYYYTTTTTSSTTSV